MEVTLELNEFGALVFFLGVFAGVLIGFTYGVAFEAGRK